MNEPKGAEADRGAAAENGAPEGVPGIAVSGAGLAVPGADRARAGIHRTSLRSVMGRTGGPSLPGAIVDRMLIAAAAGYTALYLLWLVFRWGGPDLELALGDASFIPLGILTVAIALRAALRSESAGGRRAWLFLAASFTAYLLGDVCWFFVEVILGQDVVAPSFVDIGYLAFYPLAFAGVIALPSLRREGRLTSLLDVATVVAGTGTVVWVLVLAPTALAAESGLAETLVALAYPIGDMIVLFALAVAFGRKLTETSGIALAALAVGLVLNVVCDIAWTRLQLQGEYVSGGIIDAGYMLGWLAMAFGAFAQTRRGAQVCDRKLSLPRLAESIPLMPYSAIALLDVILLATAAMSGGDLLALITGAVVVTALVVGRQIVTSRENTRMVAETSRARGEARFQALIRNASDAIIVTSEDGTVLYATPSAEPVLGRPPDQLISRLLVDLFGPAERSLARGFIEVASQRAGVSGPEELALEQSDGTLRFIEATVSNLADDPTVGGLVVTMRDVTERKLFERQLEHQAFHDPLTGLANRALLLDRIEQAVGRSRRHPARPAVLYIDIDEFKHINDSQGHLAGDQVLVEIATRIRGAIRDGDTAARMGGDEFAILLEETESVDVAVDVAERLREALRTPFSVAGAQLRVTGSVGIARAESGEASTLELLRDADIAMYEAKRAERGTLRVFETSMYSTALEQAELDRDLRGALDRNELFVVYQPLVDLAARRTIGVEALLRWQHPTRGLILPTVFIPIAEESGSIIQIGRWVLQETIRTVGAWNAASGEPPMRANVNVSARQLGPGFVADVGSLLAETGFPAELLVLELTESVLISNRERVSAIFGQLRALGIRIAIDDFGTGYSSLGYLHELPVDEIKIDRSFIEALTKHDDTRLVSTIIQLGKKLNVATIAEGIEQEEQFDRLRALGCDLGQGFLLGMPELPGLAVAPAIARALPAAPPARTAPGAAIAPIAPIAPASLPVERPSVA